MKKLLSQIIGASLGLWLASYVIKGVSIVVLPDSNFFGFGITQPWQLFLLLGIILGLINFFIKPILDVITLPLRIITLGIFGFLINMSLIWIIDVMFKELTVPWFWPLVWTTLIITIANFIAKKIVSSNED